MAKNLIGTLYDDNGVPIASTTTGEVASNFASLVTAAELWDTVNSVRNRHGGQTGVAWVTSGGATTTAVAVGTASDTVIKASAGRLCRISITAAAGTTTGTTPIWDNATGHTGTILVVIPNNTAVGTVVDVQMPAANGITVQGGANSPAMTISFV